MTLSFGVSLDSNRFVFPSDASVGLRSLSFTKGLGYEVSFSVFSGGNLLNIPVSGLTFAVSEPDRKSTPLVSVSGVAGTGFLFSVANSVLDYALANRDSLSAEADLTFQSNGVSYALDSLAVKLWNNPEVTPLTEYYLDSNPRHFATSGDLAGLVPRAETGRFYPATNPNGFTRSGDVAAGYIARTDSGQFYAASNPSGFVPQAVFDAVQSALSGLQSFMETGNFLMLE